MASSLELLAARKGGTATAQTLALDTYELWYDCVQALSRNQSYEIESSIGGRRRLTRVDLDEAREMLAAADAALQEIENDGKSGPFFYQGQTRVGGC